MPPSAAAPFQEHHPVAHCQGEASVWRPSGRPAAPGFLHRHKQHDRHPCRSFGQPTLYRHRADGAYRREPDAQPPADIRPGSADAATWRALVVQQGGDAADNAVEPTLRNLGTCRAILPDVLHACGQLRRQGCRMAVGSGDF